MRDQINHPSGGSISTGAIRSSTPSQSSKNPSKQSKKSAKKRKIFKLCQKNNNNEKDDSESKDQKSQALRQIAVNSSHSTKNNHQTEKETHQYCTNSISTTKYSYLSFLPKSLLIQFFRVSNVYFLITAVLTQIPGFSPLPGYTSIMPLCFVLLMSMMREAYEDYKRRVNDKITNNKKCRVLNNKTQNYAYQFDRENTINALNGQDRSHKHKELFVEKLWSEVQCGDIIHIEEGEHMPADIIILVSSADNGECFVQTSTLDGERALKHKQCLAPIMKSIQKEGLQNFQASIHCENPTKNLYEFNGFMESEQFPEIGTLQLHPESKRRTITLDNKQIVLRGSNLANTNWVIGAVVYTGKETKLMLNQGLSRFKQSKIEKVVNMICIYLIIVQTILCVLMSIYSGFYTSEYAGIGENGLKRKAEYLFYTELSVQSQAANATVVEDDSDYNPTVIGVQTYGSYYILLNTLIPISLVVSIEFVKLIQTPFINNDMEMYDEATMKQCQPMTMLLHEELASVKYIFADKTGTLTANIMEFKACTIASVCYDDEYNEDDYEYEVDESSRNPNSARPQIESEPHQIEEIKEAPQLFEEDYEVGDGEIHAKKFEQFKKEKGYPYNDRGGKSKLARRDSITEIVWNYKESTKIIKNLLETKKYFLNEEINLGASHKNGVQLMLRKQNDYLHWFWLTIALCHDVITTKKPDSDVLTYQGTSPDEITLLDAAKEIGYTFLDRNSDSMMIEIFGKKKQYTLLQKIEFSSDRKKMTVVVRDENTGLIILFSKGADLAIFERLSRSIEQPFLDPTKEDLIKFSTKGFRTLCFAMRVLDQDYYNDWAFRYENSKLEIIKLGINKKKIEIEVIEENITELLQREIESELFLLGATALEDKLQEGVPEAIEDFHNAGIKVWMLTGDKLETAENIGFSSKMFNEKMYIFKLQTNSKKDTKSRLMQIDAKIIEIEKTYSTPIIGTQFLLNPNAGFEFAKSPRDLLHNNENQQCEAKNIIRALEEYKHETRFSEYTLNDSWARKPTLKRKLRKRLEEIVPDKSDILARIIRESQIFHKSDKSQLKYIPNTFDMNSHQYIVRSSNIYRSAASMKGREGTRNEKEIIENEDSYGILIEGQTLQFITDSDSMKKRFLKILGKCSAVVVCRASPSQKGLVVQMVKNNEPEIVTLAIGDGANDVNMIQRAHIGIGIFGKEGYQAASNSDYAIGQFRFLRRLLFVHGRWCGSRLSVFMLLFFHKNLVFTLPQFWFGWYNGFSGQSFYDDMYLTLFNTTVTAIAICTIAIWDQDINPQDPKFAKLIDVFYPYLYKETYENDLFTKTKWLFWAAISIAQSIMIYGVPTVAYQYMLIDGGKVQDMYATSTMTYFSIVMTHYLLIFMFTYNWNWFIVFMYFGSFIFFIPLLTNVYDVVPSTFISRRIVEIFYGSWEFWALTTLLICAGVLPIYFYYTTQTLMFPRLRDLIASHSINPQQVLKEIDPERARQTHEMFKQKQQQVFHQWQMEYNQFGHQRESNIINSNQGTAKKLLQPMQSESNVFSESDERNAKEISTTQFPRKNREGMININKHGNPKDLKENRQSPNFSRNNLIMPSNIPLEDLEEEQYLSMGALDSVRSENLNQDSIRSLGSSNLKMKVDNYISNNNNSRGSPERKQVLEGEKNIDINRPKSTQNSQLPQKQTFEQNN